MTYDFDECLKMSMRSLQLETDKRTLQHYFPDAVEVVKASADLDRTGIDYIVHLASGVEIYVDVKTRNSGCSAYWKDDEPELALEIWSQRYPRLEKRDERNKWGWTCDLHKKCHYVMFKFDPSDSEAVYIVPFQQLRIAFRHRLPQWMDRYPHPWQGQRTAGYLSQCVFVPADIVLDAIRHEFKTELAHCC